MASDQATRGQTAVAAKRVRAASLRGQRATDNLRRAMLTREARSSPAHGFNTQPPTMNRALPYRLCRSSGRVRWWLLWRRHQAHSRCGCGRVPAQCEYPRWFCWRESPSTLVRSVSSRICGRGVWRLPQRHLPHMYVCMDVYNEPAEARATCISGDPAWPKGGSLGPCDAVCGKFRLRVAELHGYLQRRCAECTPTCVALWK